MIDIYLMYSLFCLLFSHSFIFLVDLLIIYSAMSNVYDDFVHVAQQKIRIHTNEYLDTESKLRNPILKRDVMKN